MLFLFSIVKTKMGIFFLLILNKKRKMYEALCMHMCFVHAFFSLCMTLHGCISWCVFLMHIILNAYLCNISPHLCVCVCMFIDNRVLWETIPLKPQLLNIHDKWLEVIFLISQCFTRISSLNFDIFVLVNISRKTDWQYFYSFVCHLSVIINSIRRFLVCFQAENFLVLHFLLGIFSPGWLPCNF